MPSSMKKKLIDPENPPLFSALLKASDWLEEATSLSAESLGVARLSKGQTILLAAVARGIHRPARLAAVVGVSRQAISTMLGELEAASVIMVRQDPDHARATIVDFHDDYAPKIAILLEIFQGIEAHLSDIIGADRLSVVKQALRIDWGPPPVLTISKVDGSIINMTNDNPRK